MNIVLAGVERTVEYNEQRKKEEGTFIAGLHETIIQETVIMAQLAILHSVSL